MNRQMIRMLAVALLCPFVLVQAMAAEPLIQKDEVKVEKKELRLSVDGKSIVDQKGNVVARFAKDMSVKPAAGETLSLQGCMCCKPECYVYDENGKCIKTYNSCTWDFDCNCAK